MDNQYKNINFKEFCKELGTEFIQEMQQNTNWTAPMIIEHLNKVFGYDIMYKTQIIPTNPITKSHRK